MKIYRLLGMVMLAVLICASFTSCNEGGDSSGGVMLADGKRLVKMVETWDGESALIYTFTYDKQGRLIKSTVGDDVTYDFVWSDKMIMCIIDEVEYDITRTLTLENGLVQEMNPYKAVYSYNSANRLVEMTDIDDYGIDANWNNDKMVAVSSFEMRRNKKNEQTLTYATSCSKGYSPYIALFMEDMSESPALFMAHPELAGIRTTQLPASRTFVDYKSMDSFTDTYTYEFDKDGYISKINLRQGCYTGSCILIWE